MGISPQLIYIKLSYEDIVKKKKYLQEFYRELHGDLPSIDLQLKNNAEKIIRKNNGSRSAPAVLLG
jgi:glutaredoxin